MRSNEDILASLQQERNCHWDYDIQGKKMFLDAMKQAQIEAIREIESRYYSDVFNTVKDTSINLIKEIESQ